MRTRFVSILLLSILVSAFSQTSVGFQNPEDVTPLKDYRLPTWGYNTWQVYLDLQGASAENETDYKFESLSYSTKSTSLVNQISTGYRVFRESDKYNFLINPSLKLYHNYRFSKQQNEETKNEKLYSINPTLGIPFNIHYYFFPKHSILFTGQGKYSYEKSYGRDLDVSARKIDYIHRELDYNIKAGYSIGRVRNVTPVIRALRFNERLQARSIAPTLSKDQISKLAQHISKSSGYATIYDRESKYFWDDLAQIANLYKMSLADVFYLSESMKELIYSRYQGWTFSFGTEFFMDEYYTDYYRSEKQQDSHIAPFVKFDWYHNFNLRSQLSINANAVWDILKTGNKEFDEQFDFSFLAQHSWMIADRLVWNNTIQIDNYWNYYNEDYIYFSSNDLDAVYVDFGINGLISTSIEKRLEDHLYLDAFLRLRHTFKWEEKRQFGQTYVDRYHLELRYGIRLEYLFDHRIK